MIEKKEGWQCRVELYKDYVIKRRKTLEETKQKIMRYFILNGKSIREVDAEAHRVQCDYDESLKIIQKSKCPKKLIGNPIFCSDGRIRQDRALMLRDAFNEADKKDDEIFGRQLIDGYKNLVHELWRYGIHEKVWNFGVNNGVLNGLVVLIDFLELSDDTAKIIKQLEEKRWENSYSIKKDLPHHYLSYFLQCANKAFTPDYFSKLWKSARNE